MTEPGNMPLMGSHQACVLIRDVSVSFKQGLELLSNGPDKKERTKTQ